MARYAGMGCVGAARPPAPLARSLGILASWETTVGRDRGDDGDDGGVAMRDRAAV
ncbi:MAG: hypothetical protein ACK58T_09930 [Phycisphaerae bacterium]